MLCADAQVTGTMLEIRETLLIAHPWIGPVSEEVGPALSTAMPQPFLKSLALASVSEELPEEIVPVVCGSIWGIVELQPPAGMYLVISRQGMGPPKRWFDVH